VGWGIGRQLYANTGVTTRASAIFQMSLHDTSQEWKMFYFNIRMRCGGGEVKEKVDEGRVRTRG
jgi:hypothetical protein